MKRKLGNRAKLEPTQLWENHGTGGSGDSLVSSSSISSWGVLSGIVLRGWESQPHGEGPDRSTQPAKETYAGHVGSDNHKQTSLRGIAKKAIADKQYCCLPELTCAKASTTEEPDEGKLHVRDCAGGAG